MAIPSASRTPFNERAAPEPAPLGRIAAVLVAAALVAGGSVVAFAAEKPQGSRADADCAAASPPPTGPSSGTAPGAEGSTGWTGGTGGSHTGTTPGAPTPSSKTEHPATASGADLKGSTSGSSRAGC